MQKFKHHETVRNYLNPQVNWNSRCSFEQFCPGLIGSRSPYPGRQAHTTLPPAVGTQWDVDELQPSHSMFTETLDSCTVLPSLILLTHTDVTHANQIITWFARDQTERHFALTRSSKFTVTSQPIAHQTNTRTLRKKRATRSGYPQMRCRQISAA